MSFENDLFFTLGDKIKDSEDFSKRVYAALSNVVWRKSGDEFSCTFRYAGGLIAQIREYGGYMDWYCSAKEGVVDPEIADALEARGWTPHEYDL